MNSCCPDASWMLYNLQPTGQLHKEIISIYPQPVMLFFSVISDKFARGYLDLCFVDFTPHLNPVTETLQGRCSDATLIEVRYRTPIGQQVCFQFIERRLCCTVCSLCSRHLGRFEVSAHWSIERNPWGPTSGCWPQHFPGTAGSLIKGWGRLWNAGSE